MNETRGQRQLTPLLTRFIARFTATLATLAHDALSTQQREAIRLLLAPPMSPTKARGGHVRNAQNESLHYW
ncbi:hypothetical protein N9V36_05410 [Luminiphilus sp.]|nr:hypothetical protein [Luminiphilus sp.]